MYSAEHDHIANEILIAAEAGDRAELEAIQHELNYGYAWLTADERSHLLWFIGRYL